MLQRAAMVADVLHDYAVRCRDVEIVAVFYHQTPSTAPGMLSSDQGTWFDHPLNTPSSSCADPWKGMLIHPAHLSFSMDPLSTTLQPPGPGRAAGGRRLSITVQHEHRLHGITSHLAIGRLCEPRQGYRQLFLQALLQALERSGLLVVEVGAGPRTPSCGLWLSRVGSPVSLQTGGGGR